jgi:hypothetical protein
LSVCSLLFFALLFICGTSPSLYKDDKYWLKIFFILCVSYSKCTHHSGNHIFSHSSVKGQAGSAHLDPTDRYYDTS